MSSALASRRKGKPCTYTFEHEALVILRTLCPNTQAFGKFLSDLLRQEEQRRIEARRLRHKLAALVDEDLTT
jgi:hypothetical protein